MIDYKKKRMYEQGTTYYRLYIRAELHYRQIWDHIVDRVRNVVPVANTRNPYDNWWFYCWVTEESEATVRDIVSQYSEQYADSDITITTWPEGYVGKDGNGLKFLIRTGQYALNVGRYKRYTH